MKFTLPFAIVTMFAAGMQVAAQTLPAPGACKVDLAPQADAEEIQNYLNAAIVLIPELVEGESVVCPSTRNSCIFTLTPGADAAYTERFLRTRILNGLQDVYAETVRCT